MPDVNFFLFGMGNRTKLIFKDGELKNALTGDVLRKWDIAEMVIVPPEYCVCLKLRNRGIINIKEDENAVWIFENKMKHPVPGTENKIHLPDFKGTSTGMF